MPTMIDAGQLTDAFEVFSISLTDPDVVDKLKELCTVYKLDADEITAEWMALSVKLNNIDLNLANLEKLENEVLIKRSVKSKKQAPPTQGTPVLFESPTVSVESEDDFGLFDAYTPGGKAHSQKRVFKTPDSGQKRQSSSQGGVSFSSPFVSTPSQKYSSRDNRGKVEAHFGDVNSVEWAGSNPWDCKVAPFNPETTFGDKYKYMFQKLTEKAHILNDIIEEMSEHIQEKYSIDEFSHVAIPLQEKVTAVGRICCDSVGKLNAQSVLLEGSVETSAGKRVPLKLSEVHQYSLFPGQIVALEGINSMGTQMVASKILEGVIPPFPENADTSLSNHGSLHVMVAAGPFTTSDSMSYEPLTDLLAVVREKSPDVCILLGPFVDCSQDQILGGNLPKPFGDIFQDVMMKTLEGIDGTGTQLVVLPSLRDVHHDLVYPQPPFSSDYLGKKKDDPDKSKLHFVSEPSTFTVNGIVFGVTSTDVLLHLGKEEISGPATKGDRFGRLVKHLFTQQSFYPIHPPPEDVPIDYGHYEEHARMTVTPHVFITPSDMRYFIKDINGRLCVNPGRLTRGQGGGTYAEVVIKPSEQKQPSIISRSVAKVIRI